MKEHDAFSTPIITPATKAEEGHDEDISEQEILAQNLVPEPLYRKMERMTRALFARGQEMANARGLILVDTKYEFGLFEGELMLMDEVHTPDSSRYFHLDGFETRQQSGEAQPQLSKEFVREWLIEGGFMGKAGQAIPEMTSEFVKSVSDRYISLYERVSGQKFEKPTELDTVMRIQKNMESWRLEH